MKIQVQVQGNNPKSGGLEAVRLGAAEERANPNTHINTKMDTKKKKNTQSKDKIRNPIRRGLEAVRLGAGGCGLRAPCDASCAAVPASTIPAGPSRYFQT